MTIKVVFSEFKESGWKPILTCLSNKIIDLFSAFKHYLVNGLPLEFLWYLGSYQSKISCLLGERMMGSELAPEGVL